MIQEEISTNEFVWNEVKVILKKQKNRFLVNRPIIGFFVYSWFMIQFTALSVTASFRAILCRMALSLKDLTAGSFLNSRFRPRALQLANIDNLSAVVRFVKQDTVQLQA